MTTGFWEENEVGNEELIESNMDACLLQIAMNRTTLVSVGTK